MLRIRVTIAEDGGIVIPVEYLQASGIKAGDEIILRLEDGMLSILTPRQAIEYAQELVRPYMPEGRSLSDELIEERRHED